MSFLIRFLAVVAVIYYFSPERGGGGEGIGQPSLMTEGLPAPAPALDGMREAQMPREAEAPRRSDTPVDSITALLLREFGPDLDAIPHYARERIAEEIARGMGLEAPPTRE